MNRPTLRLQRQLIAVLIVAGIVATGLSVVSTRYRLAFDSQTDSCLPFSAYVVDLQAQTPERGAYYTFSTRGLGPRFPDGTQFLKQVAGLPGDQVDISGPAVRVNGVPHGVINPTYAEKLHQPISAFERHETIPAGHYFLLGTTPFSYDGRYWGLVAAQQITGRAYPLW